MTAFDTKQLWQRRRSAFWKDASYYLRYVARSNFGGFVLLALIVGSIYYQKTLQHLPADYPYEWILTPLLAVMLAVSPVRTYMRDADRIFLLPAEGAMRGYFRAALRYSFAWQAAWTLLLGLAGWPLYAQCRGEDAAPLAGLLALLLAAKAASLLGAWHAGRLALRVHRRLAAALRWLMCAAVAYAAYVRGPLAAAGLLLALAAAYAIALRPAARYSVAWEWLIARERRHAGAHFRFYGWFIEVPHMPRQVKPRRWATGLTRMLRFAPDRYYLYLYMKTFLRTESLAITLRLTAAGVVFLVAFPQPLPAAIAYFLTAMMTAAQLSGLEQAHRYLFWLQLVPVQPAQRVGALARIAIAVLLLQSAALDIALALAARDWLPAALTGLGGAAYALLYGGALLRRKLRKQLAAEEL